MPINFILLSLVIWGVGAASAGAWAWRRYSAAPILAGPVPGYARIQIDALKTPSPWPLERVEALDSPDRSRLILTLSQPAAGEPFQTQALLDKLYQWSEPLPIEVILLCWDDGMLLVAKDELGWSGQEPLTWARYKRVPGQRDWVLDEFAT